MDIKEMKDRHRDFRNRRDTISVCVESMIDSYGAGGALRELAYIVGQVFRDKAEHVRTNWQDKDLAAEWELTAGRVEEGIYEVGENTHI